MDINDNYMENKKKELVSLELASLQVKNSCNPCNPWLKLHGKLMVITWRRKQQKITLVNSKYQIKY